MSNTNLYEHLGGQATISRIAEGFYAKMQDDYRLNRFFNSQDLPKQVETLKAVLTAFLGGSHTTAEERNSLLDDFFMAAFARSKRKSMVSGSDFGFFGYIAPQNHPSTKYLCESHSHLLRFMPEDFHYDAALEHLTATLRELNLNSAVINQVLTLAEQARNPVLGI